MNRLDFYDGKRVLVTGHTGFKGVWLSRILVRAGAIVTGYALEPPTVPSLWALLGMGQDMRSVTGDVRDLAALKRAYDSARPEIVFHLAAQPLVRESYKTPVDTYATNVMGTVNLLECARLSNCVKSFVNVTTDKVYQNNEWPWGYREADALDGFDPYSNSKSCSELVTASYARSLMMESGAAVSTARAGNVIGGGDFAAERIIPDCVRAAERDEAVILRNPGSIRPYQHVLEALGAYLLLAKSQYEDAALAGQYNIGPDDADCVTTEQLAKMFCAAWGDGAKYAVEADPNAPHEAGFLKLDCSKIKAALGWQPKWDIAEAVSKTAAWEKARLSGADVRRLTDAQISEYFR